MLMEIQKKKIKKKKKKKKKQQRHLVSGLSPYYVVSEITQCFRKLFLRFQNERKEGI